MSKAVIQKRAFVTATVKILANTFQKMKPLASKNYTAQHATPKMVKDVCHEEIFTVNVAMLVKGKVHFSKQPWFLISLMWMSIQKSSFHKASSPVSSEMYLVL